MIISESLRANDLRGFVSKIFEVDSYKSKIGDDEDVSVLSFTVDSEDPAKDLEHFIEMGYTFVLDADVSPGETDDGTYKVYVELERSLHIADQIKEILDGITKITGINEFRFRYFKGFKSQDATIENLQKSIPKTKDEYRSITESLSEDNVDNFFANSAVDKINVLDESIKFKSVWGDPITFNIVNSGLKQSIYESVKGPIMIESKDIAEVMFFTKYIGNYNITKIGNTFIFENKNWAVALERK